MIISMDEIILDEIEARLRNIRKSKGYKFDIDLVRREAISNFTGVESSIVYYWAENNTWDSNDIGSEIRVLNIGIAAFHKSAEGNLCDLANNLGTDIYTSLNRAANSESILDDVCLDLGIEDVNEFRIEDISPAIGKGESPYFGSILTTFANYSINPGVIYLER